MVKVYISNIYLSGFQLSIPIAYQGYNSVESCLGEVTLAHAICPMIYVYKTSKKYMALNQEASQR